MTLTSAPVSMRNRRPEMASVRNSRRLVGRPGSLVAASDWPDRFPTFGRVADISWHHLRIFGDTSRGCRLRQVCVIDVIVVVQGSVIEDGGMS